jgi:hypothetical protein
LHSPPVPHLQDPSLPQVSARAASQALHRPPLVPQKSVVSPPLQMPLATAVQQPSWQLEESQTQLGVPVLVSQRWPVAHAAPRVPHTQPFVASQMLARLSHAAQDAPPWPQAAVEPVWHSPLPSQQPLQLVVVHWHVLELQAWPVAHASAVPQVQTPAVHESAVASQTAHAAPAVPHFVVVRLAPWMHVEPSVSQQPSLQFAGVHGVGPSWASCPRPSVCPPSCCPPSVCPPSCWAASTWPSGGVTAASG